MKKVVRRGLRLSSNCPLDSIAVVSAAVKNGHWVGWFGAVAVIAVGSNIVGIVGGAGIADTAVPVAVLLKGLVET